MKLFEKISDIKKFHLLGPFKRRIEKPFNEVHSSQSCLLLKSFIKKIDGFLTQKDNSSISIRFAHTETITPLITLMNFEGIPKNLNSWQIRKISPMASNLHWVLTKESEKKEKTYLMDFFLNGKKRRLNGLTCLQNKCSWKQTKDHFMRILNEKGLGKCQKKDWNRLCGNR